MVQMLLEIRDFFQKERLYFYLIVTIIFFYGAVFFLHKAMSHRKLEAQGTTQTLESQNEISKSPEAVEEELKKRPELQNVVWFLAFFSSVVFGCGIALNVLAFKKWLDKRELVPEAKRLLHIGWGISEVIKVVILFFWFGIVFNLILTVLKLAFFNKSDPFFLILLHTFILDLLAVFFMQMSIKKSGSRFEDLTGFRFKEFSIADLWFGISAYVAILPTLLVILGLLIYIASRMSYEPPPHPLVDLFLKESTMPPWIIWFSLILACVIGPMVEEIFFRGFLYPALRKYWGVPWAMAATAALFALVHENIFSFLPIFFLGLVLCYLYEKRKNLTSCISLHMLHNAAFIIYFFLMRNLLFQTGG